MTAAAGHDAAPTQSWQRSLALHTEAKVSQRDQVDLEAETRACMRHIYAARAEAAVASAGHASYEHIPRFHAGAKHTQATHAEEAATQEGLAALRKRIRQQARARFLQRQEDELMDFDDLTALEEALQRYDPPMPDGSPPRGLDYGAFLSVKQAAPRKAIKYFENKTFLKLFADPQGRISSHLLFKYIYGSICLHKTRITLHYYDTEMEGYLREQVSWHMNITVCVSAS